MDIFLLCVLEHLFNNSLFLKQCKGKACVVNCLMGFIKLMIMSRLENDCDKKLIVLN